MRPRTACSACRQRQRRCVVGEDSRNQACQFCVRNHHDCSLVVAAPATSSPITEHETTFSSPSSHLSHSDHVPSRSVNEGSVISNPFQENHISELPPLDALTEIVSAYFVFIHDPSHNVFHRPSFMADVSRGIVPRPLIHCVIALAARFSSHPYFSGVLPRHRGNSYAIQAEKLLDLHSVSVVTLQTALLLGAFYGTEGESLRENLYYSVACRIGSLLNIPECLGDAPLSRELGIRLWWTLDMIDVWSSNSMRLPRLLIPRDDIPYPTSETTFLNMRRTHSFDQSTPIPYSPGIDLTSVLVQKIKLNSLLSEITQLNKASADESLTPSDMLVSTQGLARRLNEWQQELPDSLTHTSENLIAQAASGSGGAFVALHVGFYHFSQLLYYSYLHQSIVPGENFEEVYGFAEACRHGSTALCELLYAAQAMPGAEVYYSMVGHALVISSTVQLHILLFSSDEANCQSARRRLEQNFLILCNLQNLWRTVDYSFGRLIEFHSACMRSKEAFDDPSETFKMDKWMLRFLTEFSKPVERRAENDGRTPEDFSSSERQLREWNAISEGVQYDFRDWTGNELGIELDSVNHHWSSSLGPDGGENRMEA